ncbi:MAG: S8 family serine peptidase, partial [Thermoplasmata archaeon]
GEVMAEGLARKLSAASKDDVFNLIIQFKDAVKDEDLAVLSALDLEVVQVFHIIPAVHVFGNSESVITLSNYERIHWIETNDRMKPAMDVSTSTINATNTWNRLVTDLGSELGAVDGSGVTIVVADTGIDATHPDLDYREKTILNLKKDFDHPGMWKEMENTDTFFGHGTHCAGTIAGTGEASAGARRGVAPGASLIGLSIGDPWETNEVGGLEWVYDHSRPNANPHNIRAVSNSWGYEEQIDASFRDAVIQAIEKLVYENNVIPVFAAGNDGEEDHDGHTSTTSIYANTPGAVCVAASLRDGTGLAGFSSRGDKTMNETWPDIMAPGVGIWSARDSTGKMGKSNTDNPYYIPASGTSMATPHIAGVVALLFAAAPSLRLSEAHDDSSTEESGHWEDPYTRIHEVEYIMEATADFIPSTGDNGVPDNHSFGLLGRKHDFAQGYGLVNAERAVGLALTLEKLRESNPDATVKDALQSYLFVINDTRAAEKTDVLVAQWSGEYSLHNDQGDRPTFEASQAHYVHISNASKTLLLDMSYPPIDLGKNTVGAVTLTVDYDDDGNPDWSGSLTGDGMLSGQRHHEIDISSGDFASRRGGLWAFSIYGYAVGIPIYPGEPVVGGFRAPTIEYTTSVQQVVDFSENDVISVDFADFRASVAQLTFGEPTPEYSEGTVSLRGYEYNLSRAHFIAEEKPDKAKEDSIWLAVIMDLVLAAIVAVALIRRLWKEGRLTAKTP